MSDQSSGEAATMLGKVLTSPGAIGILAGATGFLYSWPTTRREGFCRIAAAGISSIFLGPLLLQTALHFIPWFTLEHAAPACYLVSGLPAWWVGAWVFRWLEARRGKDVVEIAEEVSRVRREF